MKCVWGITRLRPSTNMTPAMMPTAVTQMPPSSMAGTMRLKAVADSMTPAANPSMPSKAFCERPPTNKAGRLPTAVAIPAARLAPKPTAIRLMPVTALAAFSRYLLPAAPRRPRRCTYSYFDVAVAFPDRVGPQGPYLPPKPWLHVQGVDTFRIDVFARGQVVLEVVP